MKLSSLGLGRELCQYNPDDGNTQDIHWDPSNTDTLGPLKCVLIRGVSSFQGENNTYLYKVGIWSSVLIREVSSFQGCPLRAVPQYCGRGLTHQKPGMPVLARTGPREEQYAQLKQDTEGITIPAFLSNTANLLQVYTETLSMQKHLTWGGTCLTFSISV